MQQHRKAFFQEMLPNSIAILPGGKINYRSKDVEYPFRQNSDFFYLTAYPEANALAIFIKEDHNEGNTKFILFNQSIDLQHQIWHGKLIDQEEAVLQYGADYAYPIEDLEKILPKLLLGKQLVYYPKFNFGYEYKFNSKFNINKLSLNFLDKWQIILFDFFKQNSKIKLVSEQKFKENKDLLSIIHELRVIKTCLEIEKIRHVTKVSANAHQYIIGYVATNKNLTERDIQAEFYKYCLQHGCDDMAYPPIVASGNNACVLHYTKNRSPLKNNELLLIDAGAEYSNYAADITRTIPISGKFSAYQKEIYSLVLFAQKKAIKQIKPGQPFSNIQYTIVEILLQGLIDLKILSGNFQDLMQQHAYREFYMHGSGHFLGLDVHDVGSYTVDGSTSKSRSRPLCAGMVLTVEPGLYFSPNAKIKIDHKWQGIGVRIEDDMLVTETGCEILTSDVVKEIDAIENVMLN